MKKLLNPLIFPAVILLCILLPPMVADRGWWVIGRTYSNYSRLFEVWGMLVSAAVLCYWYRSWRSEADDRADTLVQRLVVGGIVLHVVYLFVNQASTAWDYRCYAEAAVKIIDGTNPYVDTNYLYPPLLAQSLAAVNRMVLAIPVFAYEQVTSWWLVFYFYQAVQLVLVFVTAELCFRLGKRLGIPVVYVAVLAVCVFFVNSPFLRTLRHQQVNLLVVIAVLYSLVRLPSSQWLCGILMALAIQVKPQGFLFPLLWLFMGHRVAVVSFVVSTAVLVLAQAGFGGNWTVWRQFIDSVAFPVYNDYFRNQSLFSFMSTTTKALSLDIDKGLLLTFVRVCYIPVVGWFVHRFITREKLAKKAVKTDRKDSDLFLRLSAHTVDIILLTLIVSPLIWEHHYVLVIPVVFWLFALSKGRVPKLALAGLVLIFVPSTFDVVLLSYHKLAGSVLLILALSPRRVFDLFKANRGRKYVGQAGAT